MSKSLTKYTKTFSIDPHKVDIHELAELTPVMLDKQYEALVASIKELGQLEPAKFYRGKLIDGRHRLKACKQLNLNLNYINLEANMSIEDVKETVLGLETRRHQSITQKSLMAYNELLQNKKMGVKSTQGEIAKKHGVTRQDIGRAKKLNELASPDLISMLFNGEKIEINNRMTDNMRTIILYLEEVQKEIVEKSKTSDKKLDMTDEENAYINELLDNLMDNHGNMFIQALGQRALSRVSKE